jgi:hypothetical protein
MYDDTAQRLEREVAVAQESAIGEVLGMGDPARLRGEDLVVDRELVQKLGNLRVDNTVGVPERPGEGDEDDLDEDVVLYQVPEVGYPIRRERTVRLLHEQQKDNCIIS